MAFRSTICFILLSLSSMPAFAGNIPFWETGLPVSYAGKCVFENEEENLDVVYKLDSSHVYGDNIVILSGSATISSPVVSIKTVLYLIVNKIDCSLLVFDYDVVNKGFDVATTIGSFVSDFKELRTENLHSPLGGGGKCYLTMK